MSSGGFFNLQTPKDLLGKLQHDMGRLEADWLDQYAAFDFFITAHHLLEWLRQTPRSREGRRHEKNGAVLQSICAEIANGSKHFRPKHGADPSTGGTRLHKGAFREGAFSQAFSEAFDITRLEFTLEGKAAKEYGATITAPTLARKVLAFWEGHPDLK
jgi:hypothetical protein